jgi:ATP-dependent Lon protease
MFEAQTCCVFAFLKEITQIPWVEKNMKNAEISQFGKHLWVNHIAYGTKDRWPVPSTASTVSNLLSSEIFRL